MLRPEYANKKPRPFPLLSGLFMTFCVLLSVEIQQITDSMSVSCEETDTIQVQARTLKQISTSPFPGCSVKPY
jgi:hypothetical protein